MVHRRHGARGFTLIEMTVVLLLLGLVLTLVFPNVSGLFGQKSSGDTVRRLADALTEARADAIAARQSVRFSLGRERRTWRYGERTGEADDEITLSLSGAPLTGAPAIVFFPDGGSTGGRITVGDADETRVIAVGWLTGKTTEIAE